VEATRWGRQPDGVSPRFHDFLVSAIPDFF
jgi:hypothetical protein